MFHFSFSFPYGNVNIVSYCLIPYGTNKSSTWTPVTRSARAFSTSSISSTFSISTTFSVSTTSSATSNTFTRILQLLQNHLNHHHCLDQDNLSLHHQYNLQYRQHQYHLFLLNHHRRNRLHRLNHQHPKCHHNLPYLKYHHSLLHPKYHHNQKLQPNRRFQLSLSMQKGQ